MLALDESTLGIIDSNEYYFYFWVYYFAYCLFWIGDF